MTCAVSAAISLQAPDVVESVTGEKLAWGLRLAIIVSLILLLGLVVQVWPCASAVLMGVRSQPPNARPPIAIPR